MISEESGEEFQTLDNGLFANIDETRQMLAQRYSRDIEELQGCVNFIVQQFNTRDDRSIIASIARRFGITIQQDGQISHPNVSPFDLINMENDEGRSDATALLYGAPAATIAKPGFHKELIRIQYSLEEYDPSLELLGTATADGGRGTQILRRQTSNSEDATRLHRLLVLSDAAMRLLMNYAAVVNAVSDPVYRQNPEKFDEHIFYYEGKLTTEMVIYNLPFNACQKLEMYICRELYVNGYKVFADNVYQEAKTVKTRRITMFNPDTDECEYVCKICGQFESDHAFCPRARDRKKHVFQPLAVPVEHSPVRTTNTFEPFMTIQQFIYMRASRVSNLHMWMHSRSSTNAVATVINNIKNATSTEVPELRKIPAWSYEDGTLIVETGEFYPNECICHEFHNHLPTNTMYTVESLGEKDPVTKQFSNVPRFVPDDHRPICCPNCRANMQPMRGVWGTRFHKGCYMNYNRRVNEMEGPPTDDLVEARGNYATALLQMLVPMLIEKADNRQIIEMFCNFMHVPVPNEEVTDILQFIHGLNMDYSQLQDYIEATIEAEDDGVAYEQGIMAKQVYSTPFQCEPFACHQCGHFIDHPTHMPHCEFMPHPEDFNICAQCNKRSDHPHHHPRCRYESYTPRRKGHAANPRRACMKCDCLYAECACPTGFYPFSFIIGAEHNIPCEWWESILTWQGIPKNAIDFLFDMIGRTLLGEIGKWDKIQGMVFVFGPPRNGKSTWIEGLEDMFPSVDVGHMPDNAQEQFGWEQTIDRTTDKMKRVILCKEVSKRFKIPMTELQLAADGKEFTVIRKGKTPLVVSFDAMMWFVGNEIPFDGAMLRRLIAVNLKKQVPPSEIDGTLIERMKAQYPKVQLRAARGFLSLRVRNPNMALNAIWPPYFQNNMRLLLNKTEPMHAFLSEIAVATAGPGRTPWTIPPENDEYKQQNYVCLSQFNRYFKRFCNARFDRRLQISTDYKEYEIAFQTFGLAVKERTLMWDDHGEDGPSLQRQHYVMGIRDVSQKSQPPMNEGNSMLEEYDDNDDAVGDIRQALNISGKPIRTLVARDVSLDTDVTYNTLRPDDIEFLITNFMNDDSDNSREDALRIVRFIIEMFELQNNVKQFLLKRRRR